MTLYLVENADFPINNYDNWWLVKARTAKEAVDRVYFAANQDLVDRDVMWSGDPVAIKRAIAAAARESGIVKRKLAATKIDEKLFCGCDTYCIW